MGQSFFIWKNKDCRSMGVKLSGPAAIIRPEERVQHIEIPGRSGDLTQLQGENILPLIHPGHLLSTGTLYVRKLIVQTGL